MAVSSVIPMIHLMLPIIYLHFALQLCLIFFAFRPVLFNTYSSNYVIIHRYNICYDYIDLNVSFFFLLHIRDG